ncbi:hypothetical protein L1887_05865 [Cichorium endivia]|nr:hypothetical protein L1887_05865 [Cichorium endivia]
MLILTTFGLNTRRKRLSGMQKLYATSFDHLFCFLFHVLESSSNSIREKIDKLTHVINRKLVSRMQVGIYKYGPHIKTIESKYQLTTFDSGDNIQSVHQSHGGNKDPLEVIFW